MSDGLVHSEDCRIGTSHRVPQDCKGADFRPIQYLQPNSEGEITQIGPVELAFNSEEGRRALEAASEADQDIKDAEGLFDIIPGAEVDTDEAQGA